MQQWEYLLLKITGHKASLDTADNMLVETSDGRYADAKMPTDVPKILGELGEDGWEMASGGYVFAAPYGQNVGFHATFKRPRS